MASRTTRRGTRYRRVVGAMLLALIVAASASCSSDDDQDTAAEDKPSEPDADCDPARPTPDGLDQPETFSYGGVDRTYLLAVPDDYDGETADPLVLNLHGFGGSAETHGNRTQMAAKGTARGYVVVTPDALGVPGFQNWNFTRDPGGADDFGFIDALLTDLTDRLCIDEDRVYVAGHSNGSAFTGFLSCEPPYRFAAAAMVSAFIPSTCAVAEASPSVIAIHGTADPGVPYEGGLVVGGPATIPPALATLDAYRDHYDCDPTPAEEEVQPNVQRKAYTGCFNGAEAVLYTVVGGGHDWPDFATDTVLDFFDAHPGD